MMISDLNYLENISEAPKISGGMMVSSLFPKVQLNSSLVLQSALSSATAFTYQGDATAISYAVNNSDVNQLIF